MKTIDTHETLGSEASKKLNTFYKKMCVIRQVEENLLKLFDKGLLSGTTHTCIGQEHIAVAALDHRIEGDAVFSNHRCHGHYISYGGDLESLLLEIMGKEGGVCSGRGGSQHLCYDRFFSNGIQGGTVINATGMALANKLRKRDNIVFSFLGDGTLGQGVVYEAFNLASIFRVPILYILEDNQYAQSTRTSETISGSIAKRADAFGMPFAEIESNDVLDVWMECRKAVHYVRSHKRPFLMVVHTYRLGPHSKGDDFRDPLEIDLWKKMDPLLLAEQKMQQKAYLGLRVQVQEEVDPVFERAQEAHWEVCTPTENVPEIFIARQKWDSCFFEQSEHCFGNTAINQGLRRLLETQDDVYLLGEDIMDPYGGAFKVTRGLSSAFPGRVFNTPISEAGIVGMGVGMAMQGLKPIVEIMFGDFLALAADQLLNHASKYPWVYNGAVSVPLVVRTPMGGGRGYGPTHSQSIEKMFLGIPGLTVVAPSNLVDPGKLLERAVKEGPGPLLFVEHKQLYSRSVDPVSSGRCGVFEVESSFTRFPTLYLSLTGFREATGLLMVYGGNVPLGMAAVEQFFMEEEVPIDIIAPTLLSPFPMHDVLPRLTGKTGVLVVEEGTRACGWGAELVAAISENGRFPNLTFRRIAFPDCPVPNSRKMEEILKPNIQSIVQNLREVFLG